MTIKIPDSTISDKILQYFGKKRGFFLPKSVFVKPFQLQGTLLL
jgi:hypothetical protein